MSFRETGKVVTRESRESLMVCDHCGDQIAIDEYKSRPHFELNDDDGTSYQERETRHLCSVACLHAYVPPCHSVPQARTPQA